MDGEEGGREGSGPDKIIERLVACFETAGIEEVPPQEIIDHVTARIEEQGGAEAAIRILQQLEGRQGEGRALLVLEHLLEEKRQAEEEADEETHREFEEARREVERAINDLAETESLIVEIFPQGRRLTELSNHLEDTGIGGAERERIEREIDGLEEEAQQTWEQAVLFEQESRQRKLEQLMELFVSEAVATVFSAFKPIMEEEARMMQAIMNPLLKHLDADPINHIMKFWRNKPVVNHPSLREFCEQHAGHPVAYYMFGRASLEDKGRPPLTFSLVKDIFLMALLKIDVTRLSEEGTVRFPIGACVKEALEEGKGEENDPGHLSMEIERLLLVENQSLLTRTLLEHLDSATGDNNEWEIDLDEVDLEKTCLVYYSPGLQVADQDE